MTTYELASVPVSQASVTTLARVRPNFRNVAFLVIVVGAAAAFVVTKRAELPAAWTATEQASPAWLLVAGALSVSIVANLAGLQARAQGLLGVRRPFRQTFRLTASGHFLNLVTKSGGMAGVTGFNADSRRRGLSVERTTAGYILAELSTHLGFTVVLLVSVPVMAHDGKLSPGDLAAMGVFAVLTGMFVAGVIAAGRSQQSIRRLHAIPSRIRNRVATMLGRPALAACVDHHSADDLHAAVMLARQHHAGLWPLAIHAIGYPVIGVTLMWVVLQGSGVHHGFSIALATYAIGTTFSIVGFLPGGIGFTELSMAATLSSYGLAAGRTAAVVGLYRLFDLWLPMLGGAAVSRNRCRSIGGAIEGTE